MTPQEKAISLEIDLSPLTPGYLNLCIRSGNQLITSGHVSDLKGWKNEVSDMFGIRSIPQNLLINPEGIIIARNITGSDLEAALDKFLNAK